MASTYLLFSSLLVAIGSIRAETYPTCGDCWCVPILNGTAPCPPFWQPQTEFSNASIENYKAQLSSSIYSLNCNPYDDSTCSTSPPQQFLDVDTAVCGFLYASLDDGSKSCSNYSIVSYKSRQELVTAGAIITHEGSCGLCSTAQDLAIYLSKCFILFGLCLYFR